MNGDTLYWKMQNGLVQVPSDLKIGALFSCAMLESIKAYLSLYELSILKFSTEFLIKSEKTLDNYCVEQDRKRYFGECEEKLKEIYNTDEEIESRIIIIKSCLCIGKINKSDFIELAMCALDIGVSPDLVDKFCRNNIINYD